MEKIHVEASKSYDVAIGKDLLKDAGNYISEVISPCKICLISDYTVFDLYASEVENSLTLAGFQVYAFTLAPGEGSKNLDSVSDILEFMASENFTRTDAIVALGGGIVGDISGFVASIFLRGIEFVQIPTTFLAAVDSSVGGKTGVNLDSGKNLAGCFWQPSLVLCDCNTFNTLPYETFLDGVAEAVKYGVITDLSLFNLLLKTGPNLFHKGENLVDIVKTCVSIKRDIVMSDERDTGKRQLLNFGHTIGHAIETCSNYTISHGHAVAIGMIIVSKASFSLGLSSTDCTDLVIDILKTFGFSLCCPFTAEELTNVALKDKKRAGETITLVVPSHLGSCRLEKISIDKLKSFVELGLS